VDAGVARAFERGTCARTQEAVLGDQGPIEIARDRFDVARKVRRQVQPDGFVRNCTSALTSLDERVANDGMTPFG
jgi:hypothetical protein